MAITRECSIEDLRPEVSQDIKRRISSNEHVIICYETKEDNPNGGLFASDRGIYKGQVLTENNMILGSYDRGQSSISSINVTDIVQVNEIGKHPVSRVFAVYAIAREDRGMSFSFATKQNAEHFSNVLRQTIDRAKSRLSASPVDIGDQLTKLSNLRRNGDITEQEFLAAKRKLLS